jgi:hypothetical protein
MTPLIPDKNTARLYVRINFINDNSSLPDFDLAAQRFLVPIIGQELYDQLTADDAYPEDPLLAKCRSVLAPLGYLMELATIQTQITDSGLRTANTENLQSAHRWEYNEVKEHLADKGAYALENLLQYLFANKDSLTVWTDSDQYTEMAKLIFVNGTDFCKYFRVLHPYRVWWELRPLISEVEDFYIKSAIGEEFFNELKELEDPSPAEKKVIDLIKKAVAQTTIVKAIEKMAVRITPQGFTVLISAANNDAANAGDEAPKDNQLSMLYDSCQRSGDAYLVQLKEYLNENAAADVFTTFFESELYVSPSTTVTNPNECSKIYRF